MKKVVLVFVIVLFIISTIAIASAKKGGGGKSSGGSSKSSSAGGSSKKSTTSSADNEDAADTKPDSQIKSAPTEKTDEKPGKNPSEKPKETPTPKSDVGKETKPLKTAQDTDKGKSHIKQGSAESAKAIETKKVSPKGRIVGDRFVTGSKSGGSKIDKQSEALLEVSPRAKNLRGDDKIRLDEKISSAIEEDLTEQNTPNFFPTEPVGVAMVSGLVVLSGAGAAATLGPSILIPKATILQKSISLSAKAVGTLKTIVGEFFEDLMPYAIKNKVKLISPIKNKFKDPPLLLVPLLSFVPNQKWTQRIGFLSKKLDSVKIYLLNTQFSLLEAIKMGFCAVLLGAGFAAVQPNSLGSFLILLPISIFAVGIAIFAHNLAHDIMAKEYNIDTRLEVWPMGVVVMLITVAFGGLFAAFMNSEIEGREKKHGIIYLAGPIMNFFLAYLLLQINVGGLIGIFAKVGAAINIAIASYNLLPIRPVDGYYIFKWNKLLWTVVIIPTFIIASSALQGVVI